MSTVVYSKLLPAGAPTPPEGTVTHPGAEPGGQIHFPWGISASPGDPGPSALRGCGQSPDGEPDHCQSSVNLVVNSDSGRDLHPCAFSLSPRTIRFRSPDQVNFTISY